MNNMPTMTVPVPTVDDLGLDMYISSGGTARALVLRRQFLKSELDSHEQEIHDIDDILGPALDLRNVKNAICDDYLLIRRAGSKPRALLDRVLLLDAGVTPQQLEAGTKFSEAGKPGITIQSIKQ